MMVELDWRTPLTRAKTDGFARPPTARVMVTRSSNPFMTLSNAIGDTLVTNLHEYIILGTSRRFIVPIWYRLTVFTDRRGSSCRALVAP